MIGVLAHALAPSLAGGGALTGALILTLFVLVVLYGIKYGYVHTFGAFFRELADLLNFDVWRFSVDLGDEVLKVDNFLRARIQDGIDLTQEATAHTWHALEWVVSATGDAMAELAAATHDAIRNIHVADIPEQVTTATLPLKKGLERTNRDAHERARAEAKARERGIDRVGRDLTREQLARERGIDYLNARINSLVLPQIRALDRALDEVIGYTRRTLARRLSRVEKLVLGGALTAAAVAALTRVFPYWQCTNVRRFNRFLCRLPVGLLDDLLGLALVALVLDDVCRIGRAAQTAARAARGPLLTLVTVTVKATDCTSFVPPPALTLRTTDLPTPVSALAL